MMCSLHLPDVLEAAVLGSTHRRSRRNYTSTKHALPFQLMFLPAPRPQDATDSFPAENTWTPSHNVRTISTGRPPLGHAPTAFLL